MRQLIAAGMTLALVAPVHADPPVRREADPPPLELDEPIPVLPPVLVTTPEELQKAGGSVQKLDAKLLDELQYDDPNSVLYMTTGVYIRQEDAYGLRPNIGLRGANSERSKKVTLMEDGVLFAPAPYSAPAAYYFPMMARIRGVEVFKGPAAIQYGPNTIGGAINLVSRPISRGLEGGGEIAYGIHNTFKGHGHYGYGGKHWGILFEGIHLQTDGFKELDGGGDTGFSKQELLLKARAGTDPLDDVFHRVDVRFDLSRELSNETYLGLSDADFGANPDRRYRGSALGRMELVRWSVRLGYTIQIGEDVDINVRLYRHRLSRDWRKLNAFRGGPSLSDILADPTSGQRRVFYEVLTGQQDSSSDAEALMVGTNARDFVAQGVQAASRIAYRTGPVFHEVRLGLRYHYDEIDRLHTEDAHRMQGGALVRDDTDRVTTADNLGSAHAVASYLSYGLSGWNLTLKPGIRVEYVQTTLEDDLTGETIENDDTVVLAGAGLHYAITPELGAFFGIHQGFSPVAPGQPDSVEAERSVNYELGARYQSERTTAELVGFYSDYSNLVGQCSFAAGCSGADLDRQFNAGEVDIFGLEAVVGHTFELGRGITLPVRATYTFTHTETRTAFTSENPQLGDVEEGDELPYVPPHQAALNVGVQEGRHWGVNLSVVYLDAMREQAGQGDDTPKTDRAVVIDLNARYRPHAMVELFLKAENLALQRPIVSRRPFGARPGKPFLIMGGTRLSF